jgi:hypothetical protein
MKSFGTRRLLNTANNYINVLAEVLRERVICQGLWPARSQDLNPCELFMGHAKR